MAGIFSNPLPRGVVCISDVHLLRTFIVIKTYVQDHFVLPSLQNKCLVANDKIGLNRILEGGMTSFQ